MKTRSTITLVAAMIVLATSSSAWGGVLYNIDMQPTGGSVYTGIHPDSSAADAVFNQGSTWNPLEATRYTTITTDPSIAALKDANGNTTGASFWMTGDMFAYASAVAGSDLLTQDFLLLGTDLSPSTSASVPWGFSNVAASEEFSLYIHPFPGTDIGGWRKFDITVDTDGDGLLTDETRTTVEVTSDGVLFQGVTASDGSVLGQWDFSPGSPYNAQPSWAGIQLHTVPEPSSFVLLAGAACFGPLVWRLRRRCG